MPICATQVQCTRMLLMAIRLRNLELIESLADQVVGCLNWYMWPEFKILVELGAVKAIRRVASPEFLKSRPDLLLECFEIAARHANHDTLQTLFSIAPFAQEKYAQFLETLCTNVDLIGFQSFYMRNPTLHAQIPTLLLMATRARNFAVVEFLADQIVGCLNWYMWPEFKILVELGACKCIRRVASRKFLKSRPDLFLECLSIALRHTSQETTETLTLIAARSRKKQQQKLL